MNNILWLKIFVIEKILVEYKNMNLCTGLLELLLLIKDENIAYLKDKKTR